MRCSRPLRRLPTARPPHFLPKAKRVIQLFMNGGASQCDLFDYKPQLIARHGQKFDPGGGRAGRGEHQRARSCDEESVRVGAARPMRTLGQQRAAAFTAKHVDDMAFLMAMQSQSNVHGPGSYLQNTAVSCCPASRAWARGFRMRWAASATTCRHLSRCRTPAVCLTTAAARLPQDFCRPIIRARSSARDCAAADYSSASAGVPRSTSPPSRADGLALLGEMNRGACGRAPGRFPPRRAHRELRTGGAPATRRAGTARSRRRDRGDKKLYGLDRPETAGFARNVPARPPHDRARRALRASLERPRRRRRQLGQPHSTSPRNSAFIAESMRPAHCRAPVGFESARLA